MVPVVAPAGTVVVICVSLLMMKTAWFVVLNFNRVAPAKPVPLIVTEEPIAPLVGLKLVIVMVGAWTVKEATLVAVPPGVVT